MKNFLFTVIVFVFFSGYISSEEKMVAYPEKIKTVLASAKPLKFPRENRAPAFPCSGHGSG